jgi:hypothetical protein
MNDVLKLSGRVSWALASSVLTYSLRVLIADAVTPRRPLRVMQDSAGVAGGGFANTPFPARLTYQRMNPILEEAYWRGKAI